MATPVIIDTDPGIDDALALVLAFASPEVEVLGVTTVGGNSGIAHTTENALRLLHLLGADDVPVAAGAETPFVHADSYADPSTHGEDGFGGVVLDRRAAPGRRAVGRRAHGRPHRGIAAPGHGRGHRAAHQPGGARCRPPATFQSSSAS